MINLSGNRLSIDGVEIAVLDGDKLGFALRGQTYTVRRTGFFGPLYELMRDDEALASAQQATTRLRFVVASGGRTWTLKPEQWIGNKFGLFDGDTRVGGITPLSAKDFAIDLPDDLPLETQVFLMWLLVWKWSAA
jgi:hypothetical protein